jgi:hypothetical protein
MSEDKSDTGVVQEPRSRRGVFVMGGFCVLMLGAIGLYYPLMGKGSWTQTSSAAMFGVLFTVWFLFILGVFEKRS